MRLKSLDVGLEKRHEVGKLLARGGIISHEPRDLLKLQVENSGKRVVVAWTLDASKHGTLD